MSTKYDPSGNSNSNDKIQFSMTFSLISSLLTNSTKGKSLAHHSIALVAYDGLNSCIKPIAQANYA